MGKWSQREKTYHWHLRAGKAQISLRIRAVWSEPSLAKWRNFASLAIRNTPSEDSDQTSRMRRLICIFAWRLCPNVFLFPEIAITFILTKYNITNEIRPRGYKTFFMLNSAEHELFSANKYENANNSGHFHIYKQTKFHAYLCLASKNLQMLVFWDLLAWKISCSVELSMKQVWGQGYNDLSAD